MKNHTKAPERVIGPDCQGSCNPGDSEILRYQRAIRAITGKWKIEIIAVLMDGPMRFGALRRMLPGITQHMLTVQLRDLEKNGIVSRTSYAEIPPRVEYALTQPGVELMPTFRSLMDWSRKNGAYLDPSPLPAEVHAAGN